MNPATIRPDTALNAPPTVTLSALSLAPLWAVLIWTGNTLVTKVAAVVIDPASIAFYRWLLAFLVLTPFVGRAVWRQRAVVRRHWAKLAVLGSLGMAMYQGLAYEAARTTSAVNMGVIVAMMPLFSALLASLLSSEALSKRQIVGAIISLFGLIVLTTHGEPLALTNADVHIGDALMLIAVASNALYGVLLRRWALPLSTWQQLYLQIGFGVLVLLPFWLAGPMSAITLGNAPLILYAGTAASIGAPFFWMTGVKQWGAARASLFMNLLPVLVAIAAWTLLDEQLHLFHAVGAATTLLGVAMALRQRPFWQ
ncbi:MAG: DMT family transporter [Casimicrobium sp.]